MGALEWIGLHLPGWLLSVFSRFLSRPRPLLKIYPIEPRYETNRLLGFVVGIQNLGTQITRASVAARVGATPVRVSKSTLDLRVNDPPSFVKIEVPCPTLGKVVRVGEESARTLFGEVLSVEVRDGRRVVRRNWRERSYSPEENRALWEALEREQRFARGEETHEDRRWDQVQELKRRFEQSRRRRD